MTPKFPTDLLKKLFPTPTKDKDGHCNYKLDTMKDCPDYELVPKTNGLCKYQALGGHCEFQEELKRVLMRGGRE